MFRKQQINTQNSEKMKSKKKQQGNQILTLVTPTATPVVMDPVGSGGFCTADQCSISNHQSVPISSSLPPTETISTSHDLFGQQSFDTPDKNINRKIIFNNSTLEYTSVDELSDSYLSNIIPPDLYQILKEAGKQGLLSSFLLTTSSEVVTDYLKAHHYQPEQIYWINQIIRGLALIGIGASLGTTITTPIANYFLTEYVGMNKVKASYLTAGAVLTVGMLTSQADLAKTSFTMAVGISTSLVGSQVTKYACNLVRNSIFSTHKAEVKVVCEESVSNKLPSVTL